MSTKRVKSVLADDDLYDDYDEDEFEEETEGVTEEDKEQLRQGTVEVRRLLGTDFAVTEAEIQEALWHYYYGRQRPCPDLCNDRANARTDVGKSVTYIKSKL